jgi:hypothetical protein
MLDSVKAGWILAAVLSLPGIAPALTISDPVNGGEYSLTVNPVDSDTYIATFTVDLSALPLDIPATSINQIDFKVANAYIPPITVLSAPDSTANWLTAAGPLTGSGCGGTNDGFVCLNAVNPLSIGSTTSFTWTVQFDSASLLPESDWHLGARYTSPTHQNGWVVSLDGGGTAVPEPVSGLLFSAGMLIVGASVRRRLD